MAEDNELNVQITATFGQFQDGMEAVSKETKEAAASMQADLEGVASAMEDVDAQAQRQANIPIIYGRSAEAVGEFTAAIQEQADVLPTLTAEEEQARQAIVSLGMAQTAAALAAVENTAAVEEEAAATGNLGGAAGNAGDRVSYMNRYMERMALRLAVVMAAYEAFRLLKGAIEDAADELQRMSAISLDLSSFGKDAADAGTKAYDFAEDMAHLGVASKDSLTVLQAMIQASGSDLPNAMDGAKLALDLAASKEVSLSEASKLVAGLLAGKPGSIAQAAQLLGVDLKTAQQALDALRDKFGGDTEAMAQLAHTQEGFWHDMGRAIAATWEQVVHHDFRGEFLVQRRDLESEQETIKANIAAAQAAKAPYDYWTTALKENEASIARVDNQLKSLNEEALKGADAAKTAAKAKYGAPTAGHETAPTQAEVNAQAEAVQRLAEAHAGLAEAELSAAEEGMREASTQTAIQAAAAKAVEERKALLAEQIQAIKEEEAKELQGANLTAAARTADHEAALVKIQTAEEKSSKDIEAIQREAASKEQELTQKTERQEAALLAAKYSKEFAAAQKGSQQRIQVAEQEVSEYAKVFGTESREYLNAQAQLGAAEKEYQRKRLSDALAATAQEEAVKEQGLKASEADIQEEYQAHRLSISAEIADLRSLESQRYAIKLAELQKELQLEAEYGDDPARIQKLYSQIEALSREHQARMAQIDRQGIRQREQEYRRFEGTIESSFSSAISGMIEGTETWAQAWRNILKEMLNAAIQFLVQWAVEKAASDLLGASSTKAAAASEISANAGVAATAAGASVAAIPFVGWALAVPTAGATYAAMMAFQASVAASGGFDVPSYSSPVTQLHPREMVLPADLADVVRNGSQSGGTGRAGGAPIIIQAWDGADVKRVLTRHSDVVVGLLANKARTFAMPTLKEG